MSTILGRKGASAPWAARARRAGALQRQAPYHDHDATHLPRWTTIEHGRQFILGLGANDHTAEVFIRMNISLGGGGIGVT